MRNARRPLARPALGSSWIQATMPKSIPCTKLGTSARRRNQRKIRQFMIDAAITTRAATRQASRLRLSRASSSARLSFAAKIFWNSVQDIDTMVFPLTVGAGASPVPALHAPDPRGLVSKPGFRVRHRVEFDRHHIPPDLLTSLTKLPNISMTSISALVGVLA